MPYNIAPGDADFATDRSNDTTKSLSSRAGATINDQDALEELAARRKSMPTLTPSVSTSLTPQVPLGEDADKAALDLLRQRRGAIASSAPDPQQGRVASAFEQFPATALEQPVSTHPYDKPIGNFFAQNPELAGTGAAVLLGLMAPEFTFARALPALVKGGWSLAKHGASKVVDYEILSHLLKP